MKRYVSLLTFTEQGAKGMKQSPKRARAFAMAAKKAGVRIEQQLWLAGRYDGILVLSAETEQQALSCLAGLTAAGNVRTETMPAYDEASFVRILAG